MLCRSQKSSSGPPQDFEISSSANLLFCSTLPVFPILPVPPVPQSSNHPIITAGDGGMRVAIETAAPQRRVGCLTNSCMQNSAKTRRVKHANATLPPLPPAPRIPPFCRAFRFFFRLFSHCKFSCKKMRSKIAKIANPGFLASLKGRKKMKRSKTP